VLVAAEANAWPYRDGLREARGAPDELVHWAALRPSTGELFEQIAAPVHPLSPSTTFHTELTLAQLRGGTSHADLVAAFARFLRPTDVVAAWGGYGPSLFEAAGGALPDPIDLRVVGQRLTHKKLGGLETYAAQVSGPLPSLPVAGRAGRRLAMLARIVASWRASIHAAVQEARM
jgi:hypothetical protein